MTIKNLHIEGVMLITNFSQKDSRGLFVKSFSNNNNLLKKLNFKINEIFYSKSKIGVVRGMHFQIPNMDNQKLIYLTSGIIKDVLLDLRKSSKTYKKHISLDLFADKHALLIPPGVAHGFLSKEDNTTIIYNQSSVYSKEHDKGILWNSFGFDWGIEHPIISERDQSFVPLEDYNSPFN